MFRRMWHKHPDIRPRIDRIWQAYRRQKVNGTQPVAQLDGQVAPPPGHPGRAHWKISRTLVGPIALLLFSLSQVAATTDSGFNILQTGALPIDMLNMPAQQLQPAITKIAAEARMKWTSNMRSDLSGCQDIDG